MRSLSPHLESGSLYIVEHIPGYSGVRPLPSSGNAEWKHFPRNSEYGSNEQLRDLSPTSRTQERTLELCDVSISLRMLQVNCFLGANLEFIFTMPNQIKKDIHTVDEKSFPYVFEQNATVPLKSNEGLVRCNVYRPKTTEKVPVIITYGPYGKDIPYKEFVKCQYPGSNGEKLM
jgi:hypothetical protein